MSESARWSDASMYVLRELDRLSILVAENEKLLQDTLKNIHTQCERLAALKTMLAKLESQLYGTEKMEGLVVRMDRHDRLAEIRKWVWRSCGIAVLGGVVKALWDIVWKLSTK